MPVVVAGFSIWYSKFTRIWAGSSIDIDLKTVKVRQNNRIRFLYIGLVVGMCTNADAQIRPATEAEIEVIREALTLNQIPEWKHYEVLGVDATFTGQSDDQPARLDGWVTFEPHEIQDDLCMMEASFITGLRIDEEYDWSVERFAYWNWDASQDGCEVASRSQISGRPVQSNEPIPSTTMAFVLANSRELLTLAYEYLESIDETAPGRDMILAYREVGSFEIDRIDISQSGSREFGSAYSATYRAPGRLEGPAVVFSVTQSGFVIHDVGRWIA